jgi:hypothetical protein
VILRLSSLQLRSLAAQLDALTEMFAAGADPVPPNTPIRVGGLSLAYAHWWDDKQQYLAEFIDFAPGDAQPLVYHEARP